MVTYYPDFMSNTQGIHNGMNLLYQGMWWLNMYGIYLCNYKLFLKFIFQINLERSKDCSVV
jgi:hypothetical protein